ncbi:hypothetical protein ABB37_01915 [Leptomonas pyrrhocoris]|uniref:Uncharacterized protein n=1 Tax=Leptomonas pyrrhocoris TaxID=157538 RepID=A0A0N0DY24_LEPPY|nr:hypothetical protein ABB37_01915 [Leptomonas pyrrhocoris]XP_015662088.1 hypothetical protein ABB37_01915 [Leptomonas pyrrhocoris]XP_015662089.1 hypothetical protein ABB37_01915 [Leptomonas pyrrhocoris]KPA83648.1 hypothetical protein ABB37_01915 [Leptomonas pyrrhocoris]KPA83649.1 hypothetical protein ABB37_01915 [Leptomonas pyrrhocoris]KPA83650.1 hypothetical protein ABB37_01915 [Leptomonas pyrrhocoris]|eukprot:XP_015662087.1 hypothetical protein ABB37_01915 [Leptomonas pyrrhocoris]
MSDNVRDTAFDAPPAAAGAAAPPPEQTTPLSSATKDYLDNDATRPFEGLQPDDTSTVAVAAAATAADDNDAAAAAAAADMAFVPVPPAEPRAQSRRPVEGHGLTDRAAVPPGSQHPVVDEQQAGHRIPEAANAAGAEDAGQAGAAANDDSAFPSPTMEDEEEGDRSPTCFEIGEIVTQADAHAARDAATPLVNNTTTTTTNNNTTETAMTGIDMGAMEIDIESATAPAPTTPEDTAAVPQPRRDELCASSPLAFPEESAVPAVVPPSVGVAGVPASEEQLKQDTDATASPVEALPPITRVAAAAAADGQAWVVDFGTGRPKPKRKMTKREKDAIRESRLRSQLGPATAVTSTRKASTTAASGLGADGEGNVVTVVPAAAAVAGGLQVVHLDGLADRAALIPTDLTTTRDDLAQRLVLRLPRLLCVNKQYPRGCGIASLTSVYNYLYSWLGENAVGAPWAPHSQEEMMSILGFEPPFGEIAWGPFTGNATLIRWFHALNRHFGHRGRAYILYKVHGHGKTTHLYPDNAAALAAVKAALRDPHCALVYHCHNHYMVPIGYQDIPHAQTDFLQPDVPETSCDTTIFIGEVSRGRHEAMYARKWAEVVKDLECKSPFYFNIRHPEQGVQRREPKKKKAAENVDSSVAPPPALRPTPPQSRDAVGGGPAGPAVQVGPIPTSISDAGVCASAQQQQQQQAAASVEGGSGDAVLVKAGQYEDGEEIAEGQGRAHALVACVREESSVEAARSAEGATAPDTVQTSPMPGVHAVTESLTSSSSYAVLEKEHVEADDVVDAVANGVLAEEDPAAERTGPQSSDDAGPAEPPASPATYAEASDAAAAQHAIPPPSPSSLSCAADASPRADTRVGPSGKLTEPSAVAKPKKERGNLHCLIIFRNDQAEEHLERYEDAVAEEPTAAAKTADSSSASSSDGSTSSDEDAG